MGNTPSLPTTVSGTMAPTKGSNREDMRESPLLATTKGHLLRDGDVVVTVTGEGKKEGGRYKMEESKSGFFQNACVLKVMSAVLAAVCVSHVVLWVLVVLGAGCLHTEHQQPPPSSYLPSSPSPSLHQHSNKGKVVDNVDGVVYRNRRTIDDPLFVTVDQYTEDRAALQTQMAEMIKHPSVRLVLNGYVRTHEIETQNNFQWTGVTAQSVFGLTDLGRELRVATSGYHHISLTVMFSGRTTVNRLPSCSIKVASMSGNTSSHTTLLFVSRTQNQRGLRIGAFYPIDTAHASGNFMLRRGDVIFVRPGTWSLGCQIHTEPFKTHLDAMLISQTGD